MKSSLESLLPSIKNLSSIKSITREKTIFDIGGKGYFENPLTDLLAFYSDPDEEHGFGDILIQELLTQTQNQELIPLQGSIKLLLSHELPDPVQNDRSIRLKMTTKSDSI
jgi:hypothetical protein